MDVNLGTIDHKKEEQRARNREYQRRYRERKRAKAYSENTREQDCNIPAKKCKLDMQVGEQKFPNFSEPAASVQMNRDENNFLNIDDKVSQDPDPSFYH